MLRALWWLPVLLAAGQAGCGEPPTAATPLVVYAAASLRDVAADLADGFERRQEPPAAPAVDVVFNFAGSNTLAQQISAAPGADVFLSADQAWVDFLERAGRTLAGSRRVFLANRLVVIARRDSGLAIDDLRQLASAAPPDGESRGGPRFLALADPRAVPAGRYAQAALERIDLGGGSLWHALVGRVAPTLDVRAALALVESDPEIAGIVYRTDAMTSSKVRVLHELPALDDAPIHYAAVLIAGGGAPEAGRRFLDFLVSPEAREIAMLHGFSAP